VGSTAVLVVELVACGSPSLAGWLAQAWLLVKLHVQGIQLACVSKIEHHDVSELF
jgi:hypothetical protein